MYANWTATWKEIFISHRRLEFAFSGAQTWRHYRARKRPNLSTPWWRRAKTRRTFTATISFWCCSRKSTGFLQAAIQSPLFTPAIRFHSTKSNFECRNVVQVIAATLALCNAGVAVPINAIKRINSELQISVLIARILSWVPLSILFLFFILSYYYLYLPYSLFVIPSCNLRYQFHCEMNLMASQIKFVKQLDLLLILLMGMFVGSVWCLPVLHRSVESGHCGDEMFPRAATQRPVDRRHQQAANRLRQRQTRTWRRIRQPLCHHAGRSGNRNSSPLYRLGDLKESTRVSAKSVIKILNGFHFRDLVTTKDLKNLWDAGGKSVASLRIPLEISFFVLFLCLKKKIFESLAGFCDVRKPYRENYVFIVTCL